MPIDAAAYGAREPTLAYSQPPVAGPKVRARLANDWLTPSVPPWRSGGARREMNAEVDGCVRPLPSARSAARHVEEGARPRAAGDREARERDRLDEGAHAHQRRPP